MASQNHPRVPGDLWGAKMCLNLSQNNFKSLENLRKSLKEWASFSRTSAFISDKNNGEFSRDLKVILRQILSYFCSQQTPKRASFSRAFAFISLILSNGNHCQFYYVLRVIFEHILTLQILKMNDSNNYVQKCSSNRWRTDNGFRWIWRQKLWKN